MTDAPEPAELAAPDLPRDPAEYAAHRPRLPLAFWLMIGFGLVCVLAGIVIGRYGARLFPIRPAVSAARLGVCCAARGRRARRAEESGRMGSRAAS